MDEASSTRISIVCLGLIIMAIGLYLTFSYLSVRASAYTLMLSGILIFVGLDIIRYGYNYNPKNKNKPVERQKVYWQSDAGKVLLTGIIMFSMGFVLGFLGAKPVSFSLLVGAFLIGVVGFILILVGGSMLSEERKKQDSSDIPSQGHSYEHALEPLQPSPNAANDYSPS